MRWSLVALASAAAAGVISPASNLEPNLGSGDGLGVPWYGGPEIWGSHNDIDECQMHQAIECLHEQICARRRVPRFGKIRCTIGGAVAYLCNYQTKKSKEVLEDGAEVWTGGELACGVEDMYEAWRQIRIAKASATGWWHDPRGRRTYGFDRSCRANECDNGWAEGSEGEQCTNMHAPKAHHDWVFDFVGDTYPNFTAQHTQALPELGDPNEPVYFKPWHEGRRPKY
ncbi:hypothetical protein B0T26DRAFT_736185 [Lasiosphaeria miniovina]|uniref:Uncharacterized protein n=1 Tax=Lasiosphaeria miniovina TaxID=1954250 RepID=A0AA40BFC7_9PEZI|nr:uncharacterized protein B0T26DRAFT_736185 [Lasiosphaeria miniovina]KAK0733197.1 hypothetical protein B0T26DRAFT_736185 [Lasiosphaeria miniovina]